MFGIKWEDSLAIHRHGGQSLNAEAYELLFAAIDDRRKLLTA